MVALDERGRDEELMTVTNQSSRAAARPGSVAGRLDLARVLVEIGELDDAETRVIQIVDSHPDDIEARSLFGKIKHMKGELTQAFACWARDYSQQPETGVAQVHLNSMLQLAEDPERGAGEFLAVGRRHLWRKPSQMLELERAFQLFARREPDEARVVCELLARKYRGNDIEMFKLAVLSRAWIAELSGDLEAARLVLEALGRERGFESDLDRALALERVYEHLGGPENLEKAIQVCEFLARTLLSFERVTTLGRLAALHRTLGRVDEAARYEREFVEGFHVRMHRVSLAVATGVAAGHYIPLSKLGTIHFTDLAAPEVISRRQQALVWALTEKPRRAAELLRRGKDVLDLLYLGDLAIETGEREKATDLYLEAMDRGSYEPHAIGWLLDQVGERESRRIVLAFERPDVGETALELLLRAVRRSPLRAATWSQLAALHRVRGESEESKRCAAKAVALAGARARQESAVGRTLSAAVHHFAGGSKGLIHEIWAERRPAEGRGGYLAELLGSVTPDLQQTVRNTFVSVREYALAKLPHQTAEILDHNYSFKITKEDEPSGGLSAGLPIALAFLSVFLQRPLPQDLASSGAVIADAHDVLVVGPVGEAEYKVRGAYNRNLRLLMLPNGNREALEGSPMVPREISDRLVRFVSDLDEAVTLAFGGGIWTD